MVQKDTRVKISFFHSGYCTASAAIVDPEKGKGRQRFFAVWALIVHPIHGYLLLDTGYAHRFYEATRHFPEKLYAVVTPVCLEEGQSALEQLKTLGITAAEIKYVLISHFHVDHISGLLDFPEAKIICSRASLVEVLTKNRIAALQKGILKKLVPEDLGKRALCIEDLAIARTDEHSGLEFYDLFKDGSLQLVPLPGHARGMFGVLVCSDKGTFLYATDAGWSRDTFIRQVYPSKLTKLFFDNWKEYCSTYQKLFAYIEKNPETTILFTHCPETMQYLSTPHV